MVTKAPRTSTPRTSSGKIANTANQVRIIAGEYRRRILHFPQQEGLRPTPNRVRETLFNWLGQTLHGRSCLDLFAGSGALGFEAASRGAKRVVMVENSPQTLASLHKNKQVLNNTTIEIIANNALTWLNHQPATHNQFDVVFLDPPFAATDHLLPQVLNVLCSPANGYLTEQALIYIETDSSQIWPELEPALGQFNLEIVRSDKAGQVKYGLFKPSRPHST